MAVLQTGISLVLLLISTVTNEVHRGFAYKCCGIYEQFDSSRRCVHAPWPQADVRTEFDKNGETYLASARDESWTSRWYPPGPARSRLVKGSALVFHSILSNSKRNNSNSFVNLKYLLTEYSLVVTVNRSFSTKEANGIRDWGRYMVLYDKYLVRPKPDNRLRFALYCVDAIEGSMAPYVVVFKNVPTDNDLFTKCCRLGEVIVTNRAGNLHCEMDSRAWTNLENKSFSNYFDKETPVRVVSSTISAVKELKLIDAHFHTSPLLSGNVKYIKQFSVEFLSSTWMYPCADLARGENGDVTTVLGYFSITRYTRAAYLVSRNLSFVSVVILSVALVAIGCKERMRSSTHGWALGCHVVCLLLFSIGQIVYSLTMSVEIERGEPMTSEENSVCLGFAIPMYFLLTAASAWMTGVSVNMFFGFKITGGARAGGDAKKRFLKLSAFAWSVPTALTGVSVAAFLNIRSPEEKLGENVHMLPWYRPTFAETRTCYSEIGYSLIENVLEYRSQKLGTSLYYYLPSLALVVANGTFLCLTGCKVRYLRRGNSLLKKDEEEGGGRRKGGGQKDKGSSAEPKSATVYIKLMLAGGVLEFLAESLAWAMTSFQPWTNEPSQDKKVQRWQIIAELMTYQLKDYMYAHRVSGYWADFFRALVVLWLAVPEPPDLRGAWLRIRGKETSPAHGAATRPAPRLANPSAPRRGQQESSL